MRGVAMAQPGGPEVLELRDVPDPAPGPGEVLVDVEAIGVNFRDVYEREGKGDYASEPGAIELAGYDTFVARAKELTGEGVDAVFDGVGKTTFYDGLKALRPFGKMILYGAASGQPDPLPLMTLASAGSLYVQRPTLGT